MRVTTLVLSSAFIAAGLVAIDGSPISAADASIPAHQSGMIDRSGKSDRIGTSTNTSKEASIHIDVDHEHGMTTVTRQPTRLSTTGETDFAALDPRIEHRS